MRGVGISILVLLAVPAVASPAGASQAAAPQGGAIAHLQAGLDAYAGGQFVAARRSLQPLADQGSAIAETLCGVMAAKGQGTARSPAIAAAWWLRAANRGYAPAQLALAKALAAGHGVPRDPGAAWVWARLAASAGNGTAAAATALADGLERGFGPGALAGLEARRAAWRPWPH